MSNYFSQLLHRNCLGDSAGFVFSTTKLPHSAQSLMLYSDFDTTSVEMRFESDFGLGSLKNILHSRFEGIFLLGELGGLFVESSSRGEQ